MRVTSESFTVIPNPLQGEISLLIAGLNIVLDLEEARELTRQLRTGMQVADPAADHITGPLERTAPTAKKATASQRDVDAGNGSATSGSTEESTVLSSETAIVSAEETAGDKRGGRRRRGIFKVLGLEEDGVAASGR
jgi:hypothetical protein